MPHCPPPMGGATAAAAPQEPEVVFREANFDLGPSEVLAQIEAFIAETLTKVAQGALPTVKCVSRSADNTHLHRSLGANGGLDEGEQVQLRLGDKTVEKTMLRDKGRGAVEVARVFKLLEVVHGLLSLGKQATKRDIYYQLHSPPLFKSMQDIDAAIQDCVALLAVPRSSLGITCSGRGAVSGKLLLREGPGAPWVDCASTGACGRALPGDVAAIQQFTFQCGARYVVVVEKDAIFQRLTEDRLFDALPCILVTGKGMPDMATRAFLSHLLSQCPHLAVLGLVDWNPAGVAILLTYKYGSHKMGLEAFKYTLPQLSWLGLTSRMLQGIPPSARQPLTRRDQAMFAKLRDTCTHLPAWQAQLAEMEQQGIKVELEALYGALGISNVGHMLCHNVLHELYI